MSCSDPIADMLTIIRNGLMVKHKSVDVPLSKMKLSIVKILKDEGYILGWQITKGEHQKIRINLKYNAGSKSTISGLKRVSKPSSRFYSAHNRVSSVYRGLGIAILSTSKGVMTGERARRDRIGGEVLCYIW
ncbi:MAG: 30S ribosomal protein S8 [Dehalococcoidia bacterium]|nr:30S ribosomal protein S8 [Dehalococcoidia bacterium]